MDCIRCKFRFLNGSYHSAPGAETDQKGKVLFPFWISPRFINTRSARSLRARDSQGARRQALLEARLGGKPRF
ncbi:hypothetical protein EH227_14670 [Rouxiella chamberiensis]|nr:hypothetical protein EH227_14670 [Rouxiella chamberiensis]